MFKFYDPSTGKTVRSAYDPSTGKIVGSATPWDSVPLPKLIRIAHANSALRKRLLPRIQARIGKL